MKLRVNDVTLFFFSPFQGFNDAFVAEGYSTRENTPTEKMLGTNNENNILEPYDLHIKKKNNKCWEWWTDDVSDFQSQFTWLFFPLNVGHGNVRDAIASRASLKTSRRLQLSLFIKKWSWLTSQKSTGTLAKGGGRVIRFCIWPTTNNKLVLFASFWDVPKKGAVARYFPRLQSEWGWDLHPLWDYY